MNTERKIIIKWSAVGHAFLKLGIAFGTGFIVIAFLKNIFLNFLIEDSPWVPKYMGDFTAFMVGIFIIKFIQKDKLKDCGFTFIKGKLKIKDSILIGIIIGVIGIFLDHFTQILQDESLTPSHPYFLSALNIIGMLSFQWIFVGIFEETITRGLVQKPLMDSLSGYIKIFKWNFHIGSVITGLIFGIGHIGPHIFFGHTWISLPLHIIFATLYGFSASYIYQETGSLVGPIVMHNIVDGLIYTMDLLFY